MSAPPRSPPPSLPDSVSVSLDELAVTAPSSPVSHASHPQLLPPPPAYNYSALADLIERFFHELAQLFADTNPSDLQFGRYARRNVPIDPSEAGFTLAERAMQSRYIAMKRHADLAQIQMASLIRLSNEWHVEIDYCRRYAAVMDLVRDNKHADKEAQRADQEERLATRKRKAEDKLQRMDDRRRAARDAASL